MAFLVAFKLVETDGHFKFYLLLVSNISAVLLGAQNIKCSLVKHQCLIYFALEAVAVSQTHEAQERRLGVVVYDALEVHLCLVVEIHPDVDLSPKTDCLLEYFIFFYAFVDSLEALPHVSWIAGRLPNLLNAMAASRRELALFS
jgi:hypothetical protein